MGHLARCLLAAFVAFHSAHSLRQSMSLNAGVNPIRKVVHLLEKIKAKVELEGEKDEAMFKKFKCYCKNSGKSLTDGMGEAEKMIPELESEIKSLTGRKDQLESQISDSKESEVDAKQTITKATTVHNKLHQEAEKHIEEDQTMVGALNKALKVGGTASFLQTPEAAILNRMATTRADLSETSRSQLAAFLTGEMQAEGDGLQNGEVTGVLQGIMAEVKKDEEAVVKSDHVETKEFEELTHAKKKEVVSLEMQINTKTQQSGDLAVTISKDQNDLEDYEDSFADDQKLQARLNMICNGKQKEFEETMRLRALELKALADTIKMLSDDEALETFKKALPGSSSSFLQLSESIASLRARARAILQGRSSTRLDLVALALHGKKMGLEKVVKMIDDLKRTLENEQLDDEAKKEYCEKDFDSTEDDIKDRKQEASDLAAAVAEAKEELAALGESLKVVKAGIVEQDKAVQEATENRKEENAEYKELMATNSAAKDLLTKAKARMGKFYNSAEPAVFAQAISSNGRLSASSSAPPAPQKYSKSTGGGSVISAIAMLITDLEKEMVEAKTKEENAQEEYEKTIAEAAEKRKADSKTVADETAQRAELKGKLEKSMHSSEEVSKEIHELDEHMLALHSTCDFILKFFATRTEARKEEIDGLIKARAVLTSMD